MATSISLPALLTWLRQRKACDPAMKYAQTQTTARDVWNNCNRGDWLLWWLQHAGADRKLLVALACRCVRETPLHDGRTVWDLLTDERSRTAVEVAERWVKGEATEEEVQVADAGIYIIATSNATASWAAGLANNNAALEHARQYQADMIRAIVPWEDVVEIMGNSGISIQTESMA